MSTRAQAVHRGADGSVHYLADTAEGSLLIITDPVLGVVRLPFDGPCRLVPRDPNLPAGYDAVQYESISGTESIMVSVSPGQEPLIHALGVCIACMVGDHDYELWQECPSGGHVDGNVGLALLDHLYSP
jgi:hypothetical protein